MFKILFSLLLLTAAATGQNHDLKTAIDDYNKGKYKEAAVIFEKYISSGTGEKDIYLAAAECHLRLNDFNNAIIVLEKYRKTFGDDYNTTYTLSQVYARNGNYREAVKLLIELTKLHPDSSSAKQLLSDVFLSSGVADFENKDSISAEINFKNALLYAPLNKQARVNLLLLLLGSKKYNDALPFASDGYRYFKGDNTFALMYFENLIGLEKFSEALPVLEQIASAKPEDLRIQLNLALLYRFNNLPEKAKLTYEHLRKKFPGNKEVYDSEISFYELFSENEKIIELYKFYLELNPDDKETGLRLAKKYEQTGNFEKAREIFRSLDSVADDNFIKILIAENYFLEGKKDEAIKVLKSVVESRSADATVYMLLYEYLEKNGNHTDAVLIISEGLNKFPASLELNLESAKIYYEAGKPDSSLIRLEEIRGFSKEIPEIPFYIALIYQGKNEIKTAIQNFTRAIRGAIRGTAELQTSLAGSFSGQVITNPDSAAALQKKSEKFKLYKAIIYSSFAGLSQVCKESEFLDVLENLITEFPQAALLYIEKGKFYMRTAKPELARSEFEKANILSPSTNEVQQALAEFYESSGELGKALDSYRRAGSLDEGNPFYYRKIIDLAALTGQLNEICDYWLQIYKTKKEDKLLKEFLIEALHKAKRTKEALDVINSK